jgi:hypothetical protein
MGEVRRTNESDRSWTYPEGLHMSTSDGRCRPNDRERSLEFNSTSTDRPATGSRPRQWVCIRCGVALETERCPLCKSDQHSVSLPSLDAERFVRVSSEERLRSAGSLHRREPPPSRGFRPDDL